MNIGIRDIPVPVHEGNLHKNMWHAMVDIKNCTVALEASHVGSLYFDVPALFHI